MSNALDYAFFYPSENGDRKYNAESFEYWLKKFFTTGVFTGELQVLANDDMTVTVKTGYCNIDGKVKFFRTDTTLALNTANSTYNRIDTIVAERNDAERDIKIKVVTGGHASNPIPMAPVRENGVYQLVLAQIYVAAGAVKITQAEVNDTRTNTDICGVVTGTVKEYDFDQFKSQFDAWFKTVKDTLSEDAAGALYIMITELSAKVAKIDIESYGFKNSHVEFLADGSIRETVDIGTIDTVFEADGSISTILTDLSGNKVTKKTMFNNDGSITSVVE